MTIKSDSPLFTTSMEFLKEKSWPEDKKPFIILYEPMTEVRMGNTEFSQIDGIPIYDMRPRKGKLSLDREGFIIADLPNPLTYEETFGVDQLREVYSKQLKEWLLQYLGASIAYIHECVIRQRGESPVHINKGLGQPVSKAHTDYTLGEITKLVSQLFPSKADEIYQKRYQMLNVWRPIRGPLKDWPLGLCDLTTVHRSDLVPLDEVHTDDTLESYQVHYRKTQKWYHLTDQLPSELLIFKAADSMVEGAVPHCSFPNPTCTDNELPRESIEFRIFVVY